MPSDSHVYDIETFLRGVLRLGQVNVSYTFHNVLEHFIPRQSQILLTFLPHLLFSQTRSHLHAYYPLSTCQSSSVCPQVCKMP